MNFTVDKDNNKLTVERAFAASKKMVWSAWTESEILDKWWAPKPWKARTKTQNFTEGGHWLYAMVGPEGEEHWARADYKSITPLENYRCRDAFCDSEGNINNEVPQANWSVNFSASDEATMVNVEISYDSLSDLETILEMGMKEGFTAAMENLDEIFQQK